MRAARPAPARAAAGAQRALRALVVAAEVEPPQACAEGEADCGHGDERAVERQLRGSEADRHDGLADRDDHHQAVTLHEVRRGDQEAAEAPEGGRQPLEHGRGAPEDVLRRPAERAARDHDERRDQVVGREREDRPDRARDRRPREERAVEDDDAEVGEAERQARVAERVRDREREHEVGAHGREQDEPARERVGVDGIRHPGVAAVHPPDQAQHHDDAQQAAPVRGLEEHRRQLRQREDEDEVEEQLERRDPLRLLRVGRCRHAGNRRSPASRQSDSASAAAEARRYARSASYSSHVAVGEVRGEDRVAARGLRHDQIAQRGDPPGDGREQDRPIGGAQPVGVAEDPQPPGLRVRIQQLRRRRSGQRHPAVGRVGDIPHARTRRRRLPVDHSDRPVVAKTTL